MLENEKMKVAWTYVVIAAIAFLAALDYELFVFPNQFAPSGLNGICTMIQYITGGSVGHLSLLINVPLAIWCYAWFAAAVLAAGLGVCVYVKKNNRILR